MNMWDVLSFSMTVIGGICGITGVLIMARQYHALTDWGFVRQCFSVLPRLATCRLTKADIDFLVELGEVNPENRGKVVFGLYLIFLGFLLELAANVVEFAANWLSGATPGPGGGAS